MAIKKLIAVLLSCPSMLLSAATVQVSADSASAESDLRTAIDNAAAGDTIEITSTAANPKITLTSVKSTSLDESLVIDKNLTIVGPNGGVTIDGGWNGTLLDNNTGTRIVKITGSSTAVTFRNIVFVNGNGTYYNNDIRYLQGGAIYTEGPLTLENCTFRNNVSANFTGNGVYDTSIINGGGAIYAMNGLTIRDCVFENNCTARKNHDYNIWGGAVTMLGGALSVSGSKFSGNSCGSYKAGGSFYVGAGVTSASFESSTFTDEHTGIWSDGAEGGGAIASVMTSGSLVIDGCAFTNCYVHSSCKGGAICCDGSVAPIIRNSSFVGCSGGEGGAVYCSVANALFVSCLFQENTVKSRGGAIRTEYGTAATLVNCSLVGNICLRTEDGWNSPGAYHAPYLRLLNTVVAYNYLNVAGGPGVRDGEGGFSGAVASLWAYNTDYTDSTVMFANTKSVTTAVGQPTAVDNVTSIGSTTLEGTISVPEANAIDTNGVLAAGGYPVKMTANGSYIGYSTDGGANWTTFYGDAANAASATLITNDIRGVNYETGKTPIGAVCGASAGGDEPGPGPEPEDNPCGWTALAMTKDASQICTTGTLVWAVATSSGDPGKVHTLNGVDYGDCSLGNGTDFCLSDLVTTSPALNGESAAFGFEDFAFNDMNFGSVLRRGFMCQNANNGGVFEMTVKDLVVGRRYLLQLTVHNDGVDSENPGQTTDTITAPDGVASVQYGGDGWTYGGTLIGIFDATNVNHKIVFTHQRSTYYQINSIQLRQLNDAAAHEHVWSDWVTNTPPTATTDGQRTRTCTAPGCTDPVATEVEVIPATGGGGDDPEPPEELTLGWTAKAMSSDAREICTNGVSLWALATSSGDHGKVHTMNGVDYGDCARSSGWDYLLSDYITMSPDLNGDKDKCGNEGISGDGFGSVLQRCWIKENYNNGGTFTMTVKNLVVGRRYLLQLTMHNDGDTTRFGNEGRATDTITAPDGVATVQYGGDGWTYGGTLIGVFDATNTDHTLVFTHLRTEYFQINSIQLRQLNNARISIADQAAALKAGEWMAAPLTGGSNDVVTLGYAVTYTNNQDVYTNAYAAGAGFMTEAGHTSIGGVIFNNGAFKTLWTDGNKVSQAVTDNDCTYFGDCGISHDYDYARLMGAAYYGGGGDITFNIGQYPNLEVGQRYMIQLFFHSDRSNMYQGHVTGGTSTVQYGALNSSDEWYYGGTLVHVFTPTNKNYSFTLNYSGADAIYNAIQLRKLPDEPVTPETVLPSIGSVNSSVLGSAATITLANVVMGTDTNAVAATNYNAYLTYTLAGEEPQYAVLSNQVETSCAFTLTNLTAGSYTYSVAITNSADIGSAAVNGAFAIKAPAVPIATQAAKLLESQGWLAAPMTGYPSDIVTDGYVITNYWNNKTISEVFAYSCNNDIAANDSTVAGVPFHRPGSRALDIYPYWGGNTTAYYYGLHGSNGNTSNVLLGYDRLLTGAWNASDTTNIYTFTIMDLEPYETYLVQLIMHSNRGKDRPEESGLYEKFETGTYQYLRGAEIGGQSIQYGDVAEGDEWWYGGTFVKVFSADRNGQYKFEIYYPEKAGLYNAIQIRKVDRSTPSAEPVPAVAPQLGSVSVTPTNSFALVTFGGINRGSGTDALMADSVGIYFAYAPQGSELPQATLLANVFTSESTITALLSGLTAGTYNYTAYAKNDCGESSPINGSFTIAAGADPATDAPLLVINEIAASNPEYSDGGIKTANGKQELDWVEIYNASDVDIDITGWYLYDEPSKSQSKWKTIQGNCIVPAKGYKIVWCDKDYENFTINEAYSRIGLSTSGENLFLASPDGVIVSQVNFPSQVKGITYGLGKLVGSDEIQYVYFSTATPGAANGEYGAGPMTPKVQFSVAHGYKTEAFDVTISCEEDPSAPIYYTTNGCSPTTASIPYTGAIHIDHTTCLRAAVPRVDSVMQQDTSVTYIFLDDVLSAEPGVVPAGFPTPEGENQTYNGQHLRYGMVQSVVNGEDRDRVLRGFTNTIATIALVVDPDNLFNADTGIYVNASAKYDWNLSPNDDWERQTMIEQIDPVNGAANEFSAPAGIRIRGAGSRGGGYAKHSFKIIFRSKYGLGKLSFPLFGDEGADEFNRFDLRCSQNHSWANEDSISDTFIHEVFSRDSQRDMGQMYTRSRYYNLFINGVYWGLYQSQERGDEDFAATYNGGNPDNYDKVRTSYGTGGYRTEVTGDNAGWEALLSLSNEGFAGDHSNNYMKIVGRNPDGTRNPEYPCYLNVTNLIAYMISTHFTCDSDCPAAPALANNLCLLRDRIDGDSDQDGFFFLRHDAEHSLGVRDPQNTGDQATEWSQYDDDPTGYGTEEGSPTKSGQNYWNTPNGFNPAELHWQLGKNPLYRRHFGDQFYKRCLRPGGAMTVTNALARFRSRMSEIDDAIVCEAARWSKDAENPKSHDDWLTACGFCIDFITNRTPYMVSQYRNRSWYPSIDTPEPDIWDGAVPNGQVVTFSCPVGGEVYVTMDGSDPVDAGVVAANDQVTLAVDAGVYNLKARALKDGEWSALQEVTYTVAPAEGDGYNFYFTGEYAGVQTVSPTGDECRVVLNGANLSGGFEIPAGIEAIFSPVDGTTNLVGSIVGGANSKLKINGDGMVKLEGADTLISVSNLVVKSGTLKVVSTGVTAAKTPVVNVTGHVKQSGGVIDLNIGADPSVQVYGIFLASKDPKGSDGKSLKEIYAEFGNGIFNATVGGTKSSAVYVDKGSVNATFLSGEFVNASLVGVEPRFISAAGDVKFSGGEYAVTGTVDAVSARVFKSDKKITVSDGHFMVYAPGAGSEIFSTSDNGKGDESSIKITGGTFELTSDDDCFNADHHITVNGGLIYAVSTANDVFDSNGDMTINGGTILAYTTVNGHEAFDVDPELTDDFGIEHVFTVNGGTIFATGGKNAAWPTNLVLATNVTVFADEDLDASEYSGKYMTIEGSGDLKYTAKLPVFPKDKCAIFATCAGMIGTPLLSSSAPTVGDQDFHDLYIASTVSTYQDQLRFYSIYGNTNQGTGDDAGNVGEYIILTNISDRVVQLQGVVVSSAKVGKKGGIEDPKCLITLGAGTVPAYGSVVLWQSDFNSSNWEKITNGSIFIKLQDSTSTIVQSGYASFDNDKYPGSDGEGSALVALRFDTEMQDTTEYWTSAEAIRQHTDRGFIFIIY